MAYAVCTKYNLQKCSECRIVENRLSNFSTFFFDDFPNSLEIGFLASLTEPSLFSENGC